MKIIQPVLLISGALCHSPQLHLRVDQWEWWMTDVSTNHNYSWLIVPCQLVKELDQVLLHIHYHEIKRASLIGQTVAQVMAGRAPLWKTGRYSRQCSLFFFLIFVWWEMSKFLRMAFICTQLFISIRGCLQWELSVLSINSPRKLNGTC